MVCAIAAHVSNGWNDVWHRCRVCGMHDMGPVRTHRIRNRRIAANCDLFVSDCFIKILWVPNRTRGRFGSLAETKSIYVRFARLVFFDHRFCFVVHGCTMDASSELAKGYAEQLEGLVDACRYDCRSKLGCDVDGDEPAKLAGSMGCFAERDRRIRDIGCQLGMGSLSQRTGSVSGDSNTFLLLRLSAERMAFRTKCDLFAN